MPAPIKGGLPKDVPPQAIWNRPAFKERGDSNADDIHKAIGMAISNWENLEEAFAVLFGLLVESRSPAAKRAYGAIASNSGRRDALAAAAEVYVHRKKLDDDYKASFDLLLGHFQLAAARRNEIVHGHVVRFDFDGEDHGAFLLPASYNTKKTEAFLTPSDDKYSFALADYRYTSEDVMTFTAKFASFTNLVSRFSFQLFTSKNAD